MKLWNTKLATVAAALLLASGYQNCSPVSLSSAATEITKGIKITNNGDVYGGKVYVHSLVDALCSDGTQVASVIKGSPMQGFSLTRDNCQDLSPARTIDPALIDLTDRSLTYEDRVYIAQPQPQPTPTAPPLPSVQIVGTYACEAQLSPSDSVRLLSGVQVYGASLNLNLQVTRAANADYQGTIVGVIDLKTANGFQSIKLGSVVKVSATDDVISFVDMQTFKGSFRKSGDLNSTFYYGSQDLTAYFDGSARCKQVSAN